MEYEELYEYAYELGQQADDAEDTPGEAGLRAREIEAWRQVLVHHADDGDAWGNLGIALGKAAEKEPERVAWERLLGEAISALQCALERGADRKSVTFSLAKAYNVWGGRERELLHKRGKLDREVNIYYEMLEEWPDDAEIWSRLGISLNHIALQEVEPVEKRAVLERSVSALRRALGLAPDESEDWIRLGHCLATLAMLEPDEGQRTLLENDSISAYRRATELEPDDAETWVHLGAALGEMDGMELESVRALEKAVQVEPKYADAWHRLALAYGQLAVLAKSSQEAVQWRDEEYEAFYHATDLEPEFHNAWYNFSRAVAYELGGDISPERATRLRKLCLKTARQAVKTDPTCPIARYALANALIFEHDAAKGRKKIAILEEQIDVYRQSIELDPQYHDAWCSLADALERRASYESDLGIRLKYMNQQMEACRRATETDPACAHAHYSQGCLFAVMADLEVQERRREKLRKQARAQFKRVVDMAPGHGSAWRALGDTYDWEINDSDTGEELDGVLTEQSVAYQHVVDLEPDNPENWYQLGYSLGLLATKKDGKLDELLFDKSIAALEEAIKRDPRYAQALFLLGVSYAQKANSVDLAERRRLYQQEMCLYRRVLEIDPENVRTLSRIALVYVVLGEQEKDVAKKKEYLDAAIQACQKALQCESNDGQLWLQLASVCGMCVPLEDDPEKRALLQEREKESYCAALALVPDNAEAWARYGMILLKEVHAEQNSSRKTKLWRKVIDACQKAVDSDPGSVNAWFNLATVYRERGRESRGKTRTLCWEAQEEALLKTLALDSQYWPAAFYLALIPAEQSCVEKNNDKRYLLYQQSLLFSEKLLKLRSDFPDGWYNYAITLMHCAREARSRAKEKGFLERAIVAFRKVTELAPDHVRAWNGLSAAYGDRAIHARDRRAMLEAALDAAERSVALGGMHYNLASALVGLGQTDRALAELAYSLDKQEVSVNHVLCDSVWEWVGDDVRFRELIGKAQGRKD